MDTRSKVYLYHTTVKWTDHRKGTMSCEGKPNVEVATPPEFKGHEGIWSPEDLFVASANICLMTTFIAVAERAALPSPRMKVRRKAGLSWWKESFSSLPSRSSRPLLWNRMPMPPGQES